ncbi:derlin [Saccharomycopsis crataegensis]|uniref:Derlin n=1 Tax=Saccharomycopsis crataegensis TaxID=43959 RepID=A0AAV5QWF0_9ASCO|nr:derlin [Saccharomycopsis crataegensis]
MENIPLELIRKVPPVTRCWIGGIVLMSILEYCGIVRQIDLVYSFEKVFHQHEYWRLLTCFLYVRRFSLDLFFSLYFTMTTSISLEESLGTTIDGTWDYLWLIFVNGLILILFATFIRPTYFLGSKLDDALLYIWSRRNHGARMEILGLVNFRAPYLPFVYAVINGLLNGSTVVDMILDVVTGHIFFFFQDVFPTLHGIHPLNPPWRHKAAAAAIA